MDEYNIMVDHTFFYPNCCHWCKIWKVDLISCAKCKMIFYCSEFHQQLHLHQHKEICDAIKHVLKDKEYMNTEEISMKEWVKIRTEYSDKVKGILERDLKGEEIEMFRFPKACVVCYRQDTVIKCNDCPSGAFCDKHRHEFKHQENYCELLIKSFKIRKLAHGLSSEKIYISYTNRISNKKPFYNMKGFLDIYVPLNRYNEYLQMIHSDLLSNPLSVYFCIQKLNYLTCKTLIIHVVGGCIRRLQEEVHLWKMLLRLIPTLTTLTITFIQTGRVFNICEKSTVQLNVSETKKLVAHMHRTSYEEYVGTPDFEKPNFIIEFYAYVNDGGYTNNINLNILEESGRAVAEQKCPCILLMEYMDPRHEEILNKLGEFLVAINPFASLTPIRHFISGRMCYSNNYVIIFKDLDSSKV